MVIVNHGGVDAAAVGSQFLTADRFSLQKGTLAGHSCELPTWVQSRLTAFQQATGIGLRLSAEPADPAEFGQTLHPTCVLINRGKEPCEICRETHRHLRSTACGSGHLERVTCHLGLTNFALSLEIPGERKWLVEGGRFLECSPTSGRHGQIRAHLRSLGMDAVVIESVYDTLIRGVPIQPERLSSSLALLESVCRQMERDLPQTLPQDHANPAVAKALKYIHLHLKEKLSVSRLARHVHLSDDHFSRLFKRKTGETFTAYVHRMRIASACRMLRNTALPVTDIAFESGFESIPHFNRLFRRRVGRSPSEFRNDACK